MSLLPRQTSGAVSRAGSVSRYWSKAVLLFGLRLQCLARRTAPGSEKILNDVLRELGPADDDEIPFLT
jgi:hypothetical protein